MTNDILTAVLAAKRCSAVLVWEVRDTDGAPPQFTCYAMWGETSEQLDLPRSVQFSEVRLLEEEQGRAIAKLGVSVHGRLSNTPLTKNVVIIGARALSEDDAFGAGGDPQATMLRGELGYRGHQQSLAQ